MVDKHVFTAGRMSRAMEVWNREMFVRSRSCTCARNHREKDMDEKEQGKSGSCMIPSILQDLEDVMLNDWQAVGGATQLAFRCPRKFVAVPVAQSDLCLHKTRLPLATSNHRQSSSLPRSSNKSHSVKTKEELITRNIQSACSIRRSGTILQKWLSQKSFSKNQSQSRKKSPR